MAHDEADSRFAAYADALRREVCRSCLDGRGDGSCGLTSRACPLDAQLPGGGWPRAALTELLTRQRDIGELRLLLPALARLSKDDKWVVLVAPPHRPFAPGFESLGVNLARLVVVETRSNGESLWAAERCLRSGSCAAVLAWPDCGPQTPLRRLQLAAEEGKSLGVVFGSTRRAADPSPAPLRIQLTASRGGLELQILKRRGGGWAPPLSLDVECPASSACPELDPKTARAPRVFSAHPLRYRRVSHGFA